MIIDYTGHSGFLAETDGALLLFDCCRPVRDLIDRRDAGKPLFVFVSHAHADHFDPGIFFLADGSRPVHYLLSFDLRGSRAAPESSGVRYLDADRIYEIDGLGTVETLLSTDEGVAFLVKTPEATLFHAGDLHWWDWPGEDPEWLAEQVTVFKREIGRLAGTPIDAAFVVLDDRLEENYAKGLEYFLSVCRARYVFPMHFWEDRSVADRFRALPCAAGTNVMDTAGETRWEID